MTPVPKPTWPPGGRHVALTVTAADRKASAVNDVMLERNEELWKPAAAQRPANANIRI